MTNLLKAALIAVGYVVSYFAASAAVAFSAGRNPYYDPAGGMQGFGDSLLFLAVFGAVATVPTAGALYFLRPYARFLSVVSILCLLFAAVTPVAVVILVVGSGAPAGSTLGVLASIAVLRVLVAPLFAAGFAVVGPFAPKGTPRRLLLTASAVEGIGAVYALARLFGPLLASNGK